MNVYSKKFEKFVKSEIKAQENFLKALENQEKNYGAKYTKEKTMVQETIDYYNNCLLGEK